MFVSRVSDASRLVSGFEARNAGLAPSGSLGMYDLCVRIEKELK